MGRSIPRRLHQSRRYQASGGSLLNPDPTCLRNEPAVLLQPGALTKPRQAVVGRWKCSVERRRIVTHALPWRVVVKRENQFSRSYGSNTFNVTFFSIVSSSRLIFRMTLSPAFLLRNWRITCL